MLKSAVGTVYAVVFAAGLASATPLACRDFSDVVSTNPGEAAGHSNGGQPPILAEGGEPSLAASGGNLGGAGQASAGLAAGMGGVALAENGDGGAAGAGGAPVAFPPELSPTELPGLVLWLEASEETCTIDLEGYVFEMRDRSGFGNDAYARSPYPPPTFSSPALLGHAALKFEPAMHLDGHQPSSLRVADDESLEFGSENFAYVLVMNWDNGTHLEFVNYADGTRAVAYGGMGRIVSKQSSAPPHEGVLLMANWWSGGPGPVMPLLAAQASLEGPVALTRSSGLNDGKFRVYTLRRAQTDLTLRINGIREGEAVLPPQADLSGKGGDLLFGGIVGQPLRGEIAEVIALHGDFSDEELSALERHLMSKYAL